MNKKANKQISGVTINYEDGTSETLAHYALAGSNENTWFKIMLSPSKTDDKIEMNNLLAQLSKSLIASIEQDN